MKRVAVIFALVAGLVPPVYADQDDIKPSCWQHWNIDAIQKSLQQRINEGAKDGSLTPAELSKLQGEFNQVNSLEQKLRVGGLSLPERKQLDYDLDKLSADIYQERHNGDFLGSHPPSWLHVPAHRPQGWDDNRWNSIKWDDGRFSSHLDDRESKDSERIGAGARDGSLNPNEVKNLNKQYQRLENREEQMKASGRGLSPQEAAKLQKQEQHLNQKIWKERHDRD